MRGNPGKKTKHVSSNRLVRSKFLFDCSDCSVLSVGIAPGFPEKCEILESIIVIPDKYLSKQCMILNSISSQSPTSSMSYMLMLFAFKPTCDTVTAGSFCLESSHICRHISAIFKVSIMGTTTSHVKYACSFGKPVDVPVFKDLPGHRIFQS